MDRSCPGRHEDHSSGVNPSMSQAVQESRATMKSLSESSQINSSIKYCWKVTKTKEGFCLNCKLYSSLDKIPKSDPLRIKSFHSALKLLKCFQTVQIIFGFLQKHHNSQLQNETSATAVSVVLVECHKMIYAFIEHPKNIQKYIFHRWYSVKLKTTNYHLSIHNHSKSK